MEHIVREGVSDLFKDRRGSRLGTNNAKGVAMASAGFDNRVTQLFCCPGGRLFAFVNEFGPFKVFE
jgi:hypothetical protein